jgi:hypothetical protein
MSYPLKGYALKGYALKGYALTALATTFHPRSHHGPRLLITCTDGGPLNHAQEPRPA